jgi:hypothetical protein
VAWIRRVRTASGATAVQIAESVNGRRRIVRHVGSARDEADLGLLMEEARRLLADDRQGVLDLGITPVAAKVSMTSPPRTEGLFADPAAHAPVPRMVSRSQVLKTSSGLLYEALAGVYTSLGFDVVGDESFRDLVIARVVEPTSLLDIDRVLAELGRRSVSLSTRKRTLRRCHEGKYRDQIANACFARALAIGDVSLGLYDVTTLYFEAEKKTTSARSGSPRSAASTHRSSWGCSSTGPGSPSRSAAFRATKPRPRRSCRSSNSSRSATDSQTSSWSPTPGCCRRRT